MASTMEASPLTQQPRPEVLEPKVVGLYRQLFTSHLAEVDELTEGFWRTLFLLKPDVQNLKSTLSSLDASALLHAQAQTHALLVQALATINEATAPADENALETLTVLFSVVFSKKFTNPSSDIIEVLAGLDNVDHVFTDLVTILDRAIKDGRTLEYRQHAVRTTIAVVAGGYQTALISYFIHKDFFPALMKLVHQVDNALRAAEPLLLAGLLANYNKFESHNQYRIRFADFVNEETIQQVVRSIGWNAVLLRERYVVIQDDTPSGWSITGTLNYVGLGSLTGTRTPAATLTEEQRAEIFALQPGPEAAVLLTLYDFTLANKLFCHHLVSMPAETPDQDPPFSSFLSFASYSFQHAFRTSRTSLYAYLSSLIILLLVEDEVTLKKLCDITATVRMCRQRSPLLPLVKAPRPYAITLIDLLIDGANHNLRKRLDIKFYTQIITTLTRLLAYLTRLRIKSAYHWSELWRSLLSLVRFFTAYAEDLKTLSGTDRLVGGMVSLLAFALVNGEAFLPDASSYDDLVYKLVESGDALSKLQSTYSLGTDHGRSPIKTIISVAEHYHGLIGNRKGGHLSPREVGKIIKQGYETLSIEANEEVEVVEAYREANHKTQLKKIVRLVVGDAATFVV